MKVPEEVIVVAEHLGALRERVVFVGGMVRGLLVTDPAIVGPRPTQDVDVIVDVESLAAYSETTNELRKLGFREDMSEDAPICRYVLRGKSPAGGDLPVDFMPVDPVVLGFSNVWYPGAYASPQRVSSRAGELQIIDACHFLATKLESFGARGEGDYYHHDLEDIVVLVDGRSELLGEVARAPEDLQVFVSERVARLLADSYFRETLPGHLSPDAASQSRLPLVLERLAQLAAVAAVSPAVTSSANVSQGVESSAPPRRASLKPPAGVALPGLEAPTESVTSGLLPPARVTTARASRAAVQWRPVRSSSIRRFSYVPEQRVLTVEFVGGRTYEYSGVPVQIFDGVKRASSAGRYYNQWIKDRYPSHRVG